MCFLSTTFPNDPAHTPPPPPILFFLTSPLASFDVSQRHTFVRYVHMRILTILSNLR